MERLPGHRRLRGPAGTWIAKEQLRDLLRCPADRADRHTIRARLVDFYTWCADTDVPEVHTLAELIDTWWAAVLTLIEPA